MNPDPKFRTGCLILGLLVLFAAGLVALAWCWLTP